MEIGSLISGALESVRVATADLGVQAEVTHEPWVDQDGGPRFGDPVRVQALVVEGLRRHDMQDGKVVMTHANVTFFAPCPTEAPRTINMRDRITLPSGLTGPVVEVVDCMVNPATGQPHLRVAWIGA
jgi:hypothetical protein